VRREELTESQAVEIVERVLFWNANEVYDLKLENKRMAETSACTTNQDA
jgi:hypothetical protein